MGVKACIEFALHNDLILSKQQSSINHTVENDEDNSDVDG